MEREFAELTDEKRARGHNRFLTRAFALPVFARRYEPLLAEVQEESEIPVNPPKLIRTDDPELQLSNFRIVKPIPIRPPTVIRSAPIPIPKPVLKRSENTSICLREALAMNMDESED
jgi:hypothetical protein